MAKTFKTVEDATQSIIDDYRRITRKVVKDVASTIQKDFLEEANSIMDEYYQEYTPRSYKRTKSLYNAILPYYNYFEPKKRTGYDTEGLAGATVGIKYDANALKGLYSSNSKYHQEGKNWNDFYSKSKSSANGITDPVWVLNNYLEGIHPTTNGYPLNGDEFHYLPLAFNKSPEKKIEEWLDGYVASGKVEEYFFREYTRRLLSRLR